MEHQVTGTGHIVFVSGIRTYYSDAGTGAPIVLVHGLGGPAMWQKIIPFLAPAHRVVAIDLPGFGESGNPGTPFHRTEYADFLAAFLESLKLDRVILCGVSYGGEVALACAASHPELVSRCVIIASTGLKERNILAANPLTWQIIRWLAKAIFLRSEFLSCLLARWSFSDISKRPPELCRKFHTQIMGDGKRDAWLSCCRDVFTQPLTEEIFRRLNVSVLIAWGEGDRTVDPGNAEEFQRRIDGSQLKIFADAAHSLPLENPDGLAAAVLEFCSQPIERKDSL
jgi:pimeloyl-ACP methyl ester carboxylesterase